MLSTPEYRRGVVQGFLPGPFVIGTIASMRRLAACIVLVLTPAVSAQRPDGNSLGPFVATPEDIVEKMLELAKVGPSDVVYDLGCGDGRIVITAARKYGAHGVGVDLDPKRIAESRANARNAGVESLVTFFLQDAMTVDVSPATVVTLYLVATSNLRLRPILTKQLAPGSRIVSHNFGMGNWEPAEVLNLKDSRGTVRTLYLWRADGKVRD